MRFNVECLGVSLAASEAAAYMGHTHLVMVECFGDDPDCCELLDPEGEWGRKVIGWCTPTSESDAMSIVDKVLAGKF